MLVSVVSREGFATHGPQCPTNDCVHSVIVHHERVPNRKSDRPSTRPHLCLFDGHDPIVGFQAEWNSAASRPGGAGDDRVRH
jgi:hypothetical protein